MGKKESKKRSRSDSEELEEQNVDLELDAEMSALASMRAEKLREESGEDLTDKDSGGVKTKKMYNKEGILQAIETIGKLPFIESYQISEFSADIQDEHDDLEREVCNYCIFQSEPPHILLHSYKDLFSCSRINLLLPTPIFHHLFLASYLI
jgi:hypothetical protein